MFNRYMFFHSFLLRVLWLMCLVLCGCAYVAENQRRIKENEESIQQYVRDHSTDRVKKLIAEKKIDIGMNQTEVIASWGRAAYKNRSVGRWGTHEQWEYIGVQLGQPGKRYYLYFENGILTSWQD